MLYIDPRLSRHLQNAHEEMLIDAIFIISVHNQDSLETLDDAELAEQILQRFMAANNYQPPFLSFIPRASAVALTANSKFINLLINHPNVQVASSATIDPFFF
jgi:hypothetical protein